MSACWQSVVDPPGASCSDEPHKLTAITRAGAVGPPRRHIRQRAAGGARRGRRAHRRLRPRAAAALQRRGRARAAPRRAAGRRAHGHLRLLRARVRRHRCALSFCSVLPFPPVQLSTSATALSAAEAAGACWRAGLAAGRRADGHLRLLRARVRRHGCALWGIPLLSIVTYNSAPTISAAPQRYRHPRLPAHEGVPFDSAQLIAAPPWAGSVELPLACSS